MSEVLILGHGQTVWSLAQRYQAAMDSPLTPLGVQQAEAQGRILASHIVDPLDYQVLTSPQPRAARTAVLSLAELGRVEQPEARLREISIGQ